MIVLILNHSVNNCGVYQYGKRLGSILCNSKDIDFRYNEIDSYDDLLSSINTLHPEAIVYNCVPGTLPWLTPDVVNEIRKYGIRQGLIVHNSGYQTFFDFYIHQNPYYIEHENNFSIPRLLFNFTPYDIEPNPRLQIGTFGFGFNVKHIEDICSCVNNEFYARDVDINLHLTSAHFAKDQSRWEPIYNECLRRVSSPSIKINLTTEFIPDIDMLNFLYKNDLNIFFYEKYSNYNGISSSIDYALSVRKPIAICKSNMFAHISDVKPSICIEDNSLQTIINNGFTPLVEKVALWSNDNLINKFNKIISNV